MKIIDIPYLFHKDIAKPPSINALARKCYACPSKVKARFREIYGVPIYRYYLEIRMAQARELLMSGKYYTVREVGQEVGYSSMSQFTAEFKKFYGLTAHHFLIKDDY